MSVVLNQRNDEIAFYHFCSLLRFRMGYSLQKLGIILMCVISKVVHASFKKIMETYDLESENKPKNPCGKELFLHHHLVPILIILSCITDYPKFSDLKQ